MPACGVIQEGNRWENIRVMAYLLSRWQDNSQFHLVPPMISVSKELQSWYKEMESLVCSTFVLGMGISILGESLMKKHNLLVMEGLMEWQVGVHP